MLRLPQVVVRLMQCCVCRRWPSDPAHVRSVGSGHGAWITKPDGGEVGNIAPLCHPHHVEQHATGIVTFQNRHGVDLVAEAALAGEWYLEGQDPCAIPW